MSRGARPKELEAENGQRSSHTCSRPGVIAPRIRGQVLYTERNPQFKEDPAAIGKRPTLSGNTITPTGWHRRSDVRGKAKGSARASAATRSGVPGNWLSEGRQPRTGRISRRLCWTSGRERLSSQLTALHPPQWLRARGGDRGGRGPPGRARRVRQPVPARGPVRLRRGGAGPLVCMGHRLMLDPHRRESQGVRVGVGRAG